MEVSFIDAGLICWSILCILALAFCVGAAISILRNNHLHSEQALNWLSIIIFLPFIGPLLYFTYNRTKRTKFN